MTIEQDEAAAVTPEDEAPENLFLSPDAVPRRQNQMLALGLVFVAMVVLAVVLTLVLLIHAGRMPSLLSYFS